MTLWLAQSQRPWTLARAGYTAHRDLLSGPPKPLSVHGCRRLSRGAHPDPPYRTNIVCARATRFTFLMHGRTTSHRTSPRRGHRRRENTTTPSVTARPWQPASPSERHPQHQARPAQRGAAEWSAVRPRTASRTPCSSFRSCCHAPPGHTHAKHLSVTARPRQPASPSERHPQHQARLAQRGAAEWSAVRGHAPPHALPAAASVLVTTRRLATLHTRTQSICHFSLGRR
jgi:hypothetical protein